MAAGDTYHAADDALDRAYDSRLMWRLLKYLRPHIGLVAIALVFVLLTVGLNLAPAWIIGLTSDVVTLKSAEVSEKKVEQGSSKKSVPEVFSKKVEARLKEIDSEAKNENERIAGRKGLIVIFGVIFLFTAIVRWLSEYGQGFVLSLLGQKIIVEMRMQVFSHLQGLSVKFFDKNPVGRLVTRVTNDINAISEMFSDALITTVGDLFLIAGISILMFRMNWRLASAVLVVIPLLFVAVAVFRHFVRIAYRAVRARLAAMNAFLAESMLGMKTVQMFCQEERKLREFDSKNREYLDKVFESIRFSSFIRPIATVISSFGIGLILWYGGASVIRTDPTITLGMLISFIWLSQTFFHPVINITQRYNVIQSAMASSERVFRLLDTEQIIKNHINAVKPEKISGRIEFRNVWFKYAEDGDWVLRDVSFKVEPGESIAVVGETGAGKTSIINLLLRFYDVQKGEILVDGIDIREIDLDTLRRHFGLVLQDVFIFSDKVDYNIHLGKDMSRDRVIECAKYVNANRFIDKMEGGYDAHVKERGSALSVGQRQLISFARALAFDPSVLVLDEATSSIDTETELLICDALQKLIKARTSIIVAHRLSTIRYVDRIIVINKGQIEEMGTREELLSRKGLFYRFYQLQSMEETRLES